MRVSEIFATGGRPHGGGYSVPGYDCSRSDCAYGPYYPLFKGYDYGRDYGAYPYYYNGYNYGGYAYAGPHRTLGLL
ncbi:MAG TPA: hypothetical protein VFO16_13070 [Pseudonocardiaceae bacterium]|nr:hypothetical protein [Pseudonocardiaceae bacterium]